MAVVTKLNESFLHIKCEMDLALSLREKFSFEVPGWRFTPKGRSGQWDGMIRLFDIVKRRLPLGLWPELMEMLEESGEPIEYGESDFGKPTDVLDVSVEEIEAFVDSLGLKNSEGQPLQLHDYQLRAIYDSIKNRRCILHAVTSAGKSAIIYCVCRYISDVLNGKSLIVVPTIGLTKQLIADFATYAAGTDWDAEENCHAITAGVTKNTKKKITVSTFQSLLKIDSEWLSQFMCIFGDEGHKIKAASISAIYEKALETPYKLTCTGTLHNTLCNMMVMRGLTGQVFVVATAKELIARGILTPLKIRCITLKYPPEIGKAIQKVEYDEEISYIISRPKRQKFIKKLALTCKGVTLVLFRYKEQGKDLHNLLKDSDRNIHYVDGDVAGDDREEIRIQLGGTNDIVIASYGTFSTGINVPAIENIILAHPIKSHITLLQSIGRGLRKFKGKEFCTLYDISDNISYKSSVNTSYTHLTERIKEYVREGYTFKVITLELKDG